MLQNVDRLAHLSGEAYADLYEAEDAALPKLARVWRRMEELAHLDSRLAPLAGRARIRGARPGGPGALSPELPGRARRVTGSPARGGRPAGRDGAAQAEVRPHVGRCGQAAPRPRGIGRPPRTRHRARSPTSRRVRQRTPDGTTCVRQTNCHRSGTPPRGRLPNASARNSLGSRWNARAVSSS